MPNLKSFVSVVLVAKNDLPRVIVNIPRIVATLTGIVRDYEIVIVDNASSDGTVQALQELTRLDGQPNLQVFGLLTNVDSDIAMSVGIENALGDFVVILDPGENNFDIIPRMLDAASLGTDVVYAKNLTVADNLSFAFKLANRLFFSMYRRFTGLDLSQDSSGHRVMSRRVVNYVLEDAHTDLAYRHLPASGGFSRETFDFRSEGHLNSQRRLSENVGRGIRMLVSTTQVPLRIVTMLCLLGAMATVLYSVYVLVVSLTNPSVSPGWASMSILVSAMFFMISVVLLVLSEYVLQAGKLSQPVRRHYIAQEFTSERIIRLERLNVEQYFDSDSPPTKLER